MIIIIMSALLLNGSTEIHQLWKFPFLIQHYWHHQKEDRSLSFFAFLKIHYVNREHPNDNDDKEDNELPFKSVNNISHIDTPLIVKNFKAIENYYLADKPSTYYPEANLHHRTFAIFHPPRIA